LELVKLLKGCKKVDHRNVFLNLAVPIMQASEPGNVAKVKLCEGEHVTLWDRWDVKVGNSPTLREVIAAVEKDHSGLEVRDVLRGNTPLYFHALMSAKEAEREKLLDTKVADLLGLDPAEDRYVDLSIACVQKEGGPSAEILSGVPPVRVHFSSE
jgi:hypothetical protein